MDIKPQIKTGITLMGLGPGDAGLLTRAAWQILEEATEIYLRTRQHPVVADLPGHLALHDFDHLYTQAETFEEVYEQIVQQVLELGRRQQGVIYAVPGHPFVAEATAPAIAARARDEGLPVLVIDGISFLEPTFTALTLDPFPQLVVLDALELSSSHVPPFPTHMPVLIAQIYSRSVASDVKLTLNALYPDLHPVKLIHGAGTSKQKVEDLALYEIDRSRQTGLLTTLYLPPLGPGTSFEEFLEIVARLRAPDGCPWDKEQTHKSLRSTMIEEAYEVLDALDRDDLESLKEELGDLLMNILLQAQIASEEGEFTIADVLHGIHTKIVRRHPHVFGEVDVQDVRGVLSNWEKIKADERATNGKTHLSLMDGVAMALPALIQADQYQKRAARVGFDWPEIKGVLDKIHEELGEVHRANGNDEMLHEIGDVLFAVVNLARWHKIDPESALRQANARFKKRFNYIEKAAQTQNRQLSALSLDEMEALWQEAKKFD